MRRWGCLLGGGSRLRALLVPACTGDGDSLRPSRTTAPPVEAVPWSQALEVAAARRGEYRQVVVLSNDGAPVPSPRTTGLALSVLVSNPELADRLAAEQRTAEVRVLRGGGSVEITIDLTEVAADIAGATEPAEVDEGLAGSPLNIALIWTVTAPVGGAHDAPRRRGDGDDCGGVVPMWRLAPAYSVTSARSSGLLSGSRTQCCDTVAR